MVGDEGWRPPLADFSLRCSVNIQVNLIFTTALLVHRTRGSSHITHNKNPDKQGSYYGG
jgi:hypothetical protein